LRERFKGPLLIAATAILWSFGGLFIKLISWDAMTIIGMRAVFAAAVLALYMKKPRITFRPSVLLGALCMSGTTILFVFANKLTTSANAIVLQYTSPIFIVVLSAVFLKKRPTATELVSVAAVFAGIALFFFDQLKPSAMLGNILACLSGLTFSGVFLINQMPDTRPEEALLLGHIINIVIGLPFIITHITAEPVSWLAIILMGVFQLGLSYVLFTIGIKLTMPITASLISFIEPLLNPVWVLLLTGEKPSAWALAGAVVIIATIAVYTLLSTRRDMRLEETGETKEKAV